MRRPTLLSCLAVLVFASAATTAEPNFTRQFDLIYHRQDGYVLTMERVAPKKGANGAAIVMVMSGGWFSNHEFTRPHEKNQLPAFSKLNAAELVKRGYTLFYVVHATQPKFTIREIHDQISAAVRHIRSNSLKYKIDGKRIGIMGGSAGGHLSLMQGTKGEARKASESGTVESSKVQAVVAYFPPTDFVNYGGEGVFFDKVVRQVIPNGRNPFLQALDFVEFDQAAVRRTKVTDKKRLAEHYKYIAPFYHVTKDDAPTLLLHGDADKLVPLQQSERIAAKYKQIGVPHKLYLKKGGNHGWPATAAEATMIAGWFDQHLAK